MIPYYAGLRFRYKCVRHLLGHAWNLDTVKKVKFLIQNPVRHRKFNAAERRKKKAHFDKTREYWFITKTCLFKYTEHFTTKKKK